MPMTARVVATAIGLFLAVCFATAVFAVRPLSWECLGLGIVAGGFGADLLSGAVRGRWPESALIWLHFTIGR